MKRLSFPKAFFKKGNSPAPTPASAARVLGSVRGATEAGCSFLLPVPPFPPGAHQQPQPPPSHSRSWAGHLALGLSPMSLVNLPIPGFRHAAVSRLRHANQPTATRDFQELEKNNPRSRQPLTAPPKSNCGSRLPSISRRGRGGCRNPGPHSSNYKLFS